MSLRTSSGWDDEHVSPSHWIVYVHCPSENEMCVVYLYEINLSALTFILNHVLRKKNFIKRKNCNDEMYRLISILQKTGLFSSF